MARNYNPIGTGTRNFPLNGPVDWLLEVKRAACAAGVSAGEFIRSRFERGVAAENPALAVKLQKVRANYYGPKRAAMSTLLLMIFCGALALGGHHDLRRAGRVIRGRDHAVESDFKS